MIIWGGSAKLIGSDRQVQTEVLEMIAQGVRVEACRECSDQFGVTMELEKLGIDVKYMGALFTEYLKNGEKVLSL